VGLDVSDHMLAEARANCSEHALGNVSLLKSEDALSALQGEFDLIHSYIVFQHIPLERGQRLFLGLLRHLRPGGIGVLHFTYFTGSRTSGLRRRWLRARRSLRKIVDRLRAGGARPRRDPGMQMNAYDLNGLLLALQSLGVARIYSELTDH